MWFLIGGHTLIALVTLHSLMSIIVTLEKILEFTSHTYIISVYPWQPRQNDWYNFFRKCSCITTTCVSMATT